MSCSKQLMSAMHLNTIILLELSRGYGMKIFFAIRLV